MSNIENMTSDSRVWVFQSNRELSSAETESLKEKVSAFVAGWTAHDNRLEAVAEIYYNRFLVLMVNEKQAMASGCSIDKSVKFIKEAEIEFKISLLDRMNLAYRKGDKVLSLPKAEFEQLIQKGEITGQTIVFNNLVVTKAEFDANWEVPLVDSWHKVLV